MVLNVTVRCGFAGLVGDAVLPPDMDDRRGVASLEPDAMMQAGFYVAVVEGRLRMMVFSLYARC